VRPQPIVKYELNKTFVPWEPADHVGEPLESESNDRHNLVLFVLLNLKNSGV